MRQFQLSRFALLFIAMILGPHAFAGPTGTTLTATKSAVAKWTKTDTYTWNITKTTPPNQVPYVIPLGQTQQVTFTVTVTKIGPVSTTWNTPITGEVCVTNTGTSSTSGLYIKDQLENAADSSVVEGPLVLEVSSELAPSESRCFPYQFTSVIDPNVQYRNHAIISIDNYLNHEGTNYSIDTFADVLPEVHEVQIDGSATINDHMSCPTGMTCTPPSFTQVVTESTSIPYVLTIKNDSVACGLTLTPVNSAELLPIDHPVPQIATASITLYTGSCHPVFQTGDYCTYSQGGWGATPNGNNAAGILQAHFSEVYPSGATVGIVDPGYSMRFTSSAAIESYLPAVGTAGILNANLVNPLTSSSGIFGGQVLAYQLNIDFNHANLIQGTSGDIAGLVLKNTGTSLDGKTLAEILIIINTALGGGEMPSGYTASTLNALTANLVLSFDNCIPSAWAMTHLS